LATAGDGRRNAELSTDATGKRRRRIAASFVPKKILFLYGFANEYSKMLKAICLALTCLLGMAVVLALRPIGNKSTAAEMAPNSSASVVNPDDELNLTALTVNTWSKADKLPVAFTEDKKAIVTVEDIKIDPIVKTGAEPSQSAAKPTREITSWHWHEGSKKIERH
jgi:hypothetical protein